METTNQLMPIQPEKIQQSIQAAPATLQANTKSRNNAIAFADNLLQQAKVGGMNAQIDASMADFIVKAKRTYTTIKEARMPFTQVMDEVKKQFTTCENDIKAKIDEVQKCRNIYAAEVQKQREEEERKARIAQLQEQEKIEVRSKIDNLLNIAFNHFLRSRLEAISNFIINRTLENIGTAENSLNNTSQELKDEDILKITIINPSATYLTEQDMNNMFIISRDEQSTKWREEYSRLISIAIMDAKSKLPAKYEELQKAKELAEKGQKEELERMEKERRKREAEEQAQREKEAKERLEKELAEQKAKADAQMLDNQMNGLFAIPTPQTTGIKKQLEIVVENSAGYGLLFSFWFNNEGKDWEKEKIEKMTIERMRKFCEKTANSTGEMIDSPYIKYNEIVIAK